MISNSETTGTKTVPTDAAGRLMVALNQPTIEAARDLVDQLDGVVSVFKIGLQLQLMRANGDFVQYLLDSGKRVFLDYKYFDIADTVADAVGRAARMGVAFLTIHGNREIVRAAVAARGDADLKLLAVTVLTSLDADDLKELYFGEDVDLRTLVLYRARNAIAHGCDGVVASPEEARAIRAIDGAGNLAIVTPGIRAAGAGLDDHKRAGTPGSAIADGSDYLVVGRPIIRAEDPVAAARLYIDQMQAAFDRRD